MAFGTTPADTALAAMADALCSGEQLRDVARQQHDTFIITGASVPSYWTFFAIAQDMLGDIFAIQEHGSPSRSAEAAQAVAYQQGIGLVAGPFGQNWTLWCGSVVAAP